ncbi:MAG: hypothetical protein MUF41_06525, partial [Sphingopyxis sp.]|nr:hypothetical protein [Sphingopyxis sp.]
NDSAAAFNRMLAGQSQLSGAALERRVAEPARHPLGSPQNPVRAESPVGQRAYLSRLRCANGRAPTFSRAGNVGFGVFGNIVDRYVVECAGSSPATTMIDMDMYHPGHIERAAVPGFTIDGSAS